ncbi:MAG: plasmid pRiA4b ORF-3 family protein [Crocinitomicaceae bacterium]|nr:plasmid pRiA4b ORF-3 family protein [Crocinitomicaceae bacterium]
MAGLKFRVLLDSKDKNEVFRDILISDQDNYESLYRAILSAYNFSNDQMASFYISNENWDKGFEISLFDMSFGEDDSQILPGVMSTSKIGDFIQEPDQKIILVHDFLRMWIFLIELIDYTEETPDEVKIVLAVGNAPHEESKPAQDENLQFETDSEFEEEDDDEFGFSDFQDEYDY